MHHFECCVKISHCFAGDGNQPFVGNLHAVKPPAWYSLSLSDRLWFPDMFGERLAARWVVPPDTKMYYRWHNQKKDKCSLYPCFRGNGCHPLIPLDFLFYVHIYIYIKLACGHPHTHVLLD